MLRQFMTLLLRCEQIDVLELLIPKHVERLLNLEKNHFVKKVLVMPDKEVTLPHYTVEEELFLVPGPEIRETGGRGGQESSQAVFYARAHLGAIKRKKMHHAQCS